jgi:His-Xaa-Ser system protein HxsD
LQEAAGRLIGSASCQISSRDDQYVVTVEPSGGADVDALRRRYLDLVTDENLRAKIRRETDGVRDVVLALAFGSLVQETQAS